MRLIVPNNLKLLASKLGLMQYARYFYMNKYFADMTSEYKKFLFTKDIPLPDSLIWEPTGKCNLRCKFCFINFDSTTKFKEMTFEDFKIMINKMPFIRHINMVGGELTLRHDLVDIIKYCKDKKIQVNFITNATIMPEKLIKDLGEFKDMTSVTVSIDGPQEIHNKVRGWDMAYQRAMESIRLMRKEGILVNVSSVITKDTIVYLKELLEEVKKAGVNYIELKIEKMYTKETIEESSKILSIENTIDNFPLSTGDSEMADYSFDELKIAINEIKDTSKRIGLPYGFLPFPLAKKLEQYYYRKYKTEDHFCKHLLTPRIDCSGNFVFCFAIKKIFGNILEQSFEDIWYCKELVEFRKKFLSSPVLPICQTCEKLVVVEEEKPK